MLRTFQMPLVYATSAGDINSLVNLLVSLWRFITYVRKPRCDRNKLYALTTAVPWGFSCCKFLGDGSVVVDSFIVALIGCGSYCIASI